jgi:hypothetical protein
LRLKATDAQAKNYRVYFNGRVAQYALEASEEENWIIVLDNSFIGMIAPITKNPGEPDMTSPEPIELKTKKLFGKVELKMIPLKVPRDE